MRLAAAPSDHPFPFCAPPVQKGVTEGAQLWLDGRGVSVPKYPRGNFLGPTLLGGITPDMRAYTEEIFGPVLVCLEVSRWECAAGSCLCGMCCTGTGGRISVWAADERRICTLPSNPVRLLIWTLLLSWSMATSTATAQPSSRTRALQHASSSTRWGGAHCARSRGVCSGINGNYACMT